MIALDLDGTLLDYAPAGPNPRVNYALIRALTAQGADQVAIVTNQGGLPWGVLGARRKEDGAPYPQPAQFCLRLRCAIHALTLARIDVEFVRVSCWHDAATRQPNVAAAIQTAAQQVRADLDGLHWVDWRVYTTARARKPQPLMLTSVGASEYWGDSDEDEGAARAAGVPFVRVERFFG